MAKRSQAAGSTGPARDAPRGGAGPSAQGTDAARGGAAKGAKPAAPHWSTGSNREAWRVQAILARLDAAYPDARLILRFENPFQLLCATVLAAQATDEKVNEVTPSLFQRYPTPAELARAAFEDVAAMVRPTGYYRQKAQRLMEVSRGLVERFGGEVPRSVEELTSLPGVGKKTAIMVINHAYRIPVGIAVDTHVQRVAQRLDWSHQRDPERMEEELREVVPQDRWITFQDLIAFHGRAHCKAPEPRCSGCPIHDLCYFPGKVYR